MKFIEKIIKVLKGGPVIYQQHTPEIIYPNYTKYQLDDIPADKLYFGKIAIVEERDVPVFGPSAAKSIYSYLEEKGLSADIEFRQQLAETYCDEYEYVATAQQNHDLLEALNNVTDLRHTIYEYYMYTEKCIWERLKSYPTKFADSGIHVFKNINHIFNSNYYPKKYEIVYTISDDSYWVNLSDVEDMPLYGFIGYRQKLRDIVSNFVDVYDIKDEYVLPFINDDKTRVLCIHSLTADGDDYNVYVSDNYTYIKCNNISIDQ